MTPAHEVMHALSRAHEHQRPDRDKYVTIDEKNTCQFHITTHNYNGIPLYVQVLNRWKKLMI